MKMKKNTFSLYIIITESIVREISFRIKRRREFSSVGLQQVNRIVEVESYYFITHLRKFALAYRSI